MRALAFFLAASCSILACAGHRKPPALTKPIAHEQNPPQKTANPQTKPASTDQKAASSKPPTTEEEEWGILSRSTLGYKAKLTSDLKAIDVFDEKGVRLFSMNGMERATFDSTGKLIFASNDKLSALYDVPSGNKLSERASRPLGPSAFFPDGKRIIEIGEGIRIIDVPSLKTRLEKLGAHSEYCQTAHRAFVLADTARPNAKSMDLKLLVFNTDDEKLIGSIPMNEAFVTLPAYSFSADGKKIGWALGGASVWDSTTNKVIVLESGDVPEHPRYYPSAPYFAADTNSVCIEQEGAVRTISIHERKKGRVRHCLFVGRGQGWVAEASTGDIEAVVIDIPVTPGWSHATGSRGLYYNVTVEAVNSDLSKIAFIEEKPTVPPSDEEEIALTLADAKTGDIIWRKELGKQLRDTHQFEVSFGDRGKTVVVYNGDTQRMVILDVATGTEIKGKD